MLGDALRHLILPAVALATIPLAVITRMTRASLLEELTRDYIRTARAKGLSQLAVVVRHGLGNALLPVLTVIGLQIGRLLAGAILTETIFSWPGIGRWVYESIESRDYAIVQGATLFIARDRRRGEPGHRPALRRRRSPHQVLMTAPARPRARHPLMATVEVVSAPVMGRGAPTRSPRRGAGSSPARSHGPGSGSCPRSC